MRILELPINNVIRCKCGCKFEFDNVDIIISKRYNNMFGIRFGEPTMIYEAFVNCPFCRKKYIIENWPIPIDVREEI